MRESVRRWRCSVLLAGVLFCCAAARGEEAALDFARDVQPILSDNCYFCHGPDAGKRKANLRLDTLDPKLGPFVKQLDTSYAGFTVDDPNPEAGDPVHLSYSVTGATGGIGIYPIPGAVYDSPVTVVPPMPNRAVK